MFRWKPVATRVQASSKHGGIMTKRIILLGISLAFASSVNASEKVRYAYDSYGRLKAVSHEAGPNSGKSSIYSYDPLGNRTDVLVSAQAGGGNCTFSNRDGSYSPDPEFPSQDRYLGWIEISGICTSQTTLSYSFSGPGSSAGNFTIQPSASSYYYYEIPTPCAYAGSGASTVTIQIVSGPGTVIKPVATLQLYC